MYLNMSSFWYHPSITRKGQILELPKVPNLAIETTLVNTRNGEMTLKEYVHGGLADGLVILHKGTIIYEAYPGMFEFEKHAWFSVTKTLVSAVVGILEDRGLIDINLPIENYLEESKNTNWEGTTVRDILDMASGIDCIDDTSSPETCFFKIFGQAVGWSFTEMESENPLEVFLGIPRHRPPGEVFKYATINTQILTYLIERVTNESFNDFLEREIWQKIGAESDGLMMTSKKGHAHAGRGMSSNLRDLARYGLIYTPYEKSRIPIISEKILANIQHGRPHLLGSTTFPNLIHDESLNHNAYQWDHVTTDGDFFKSGFGGQGLYISPKTDIVIAFFGTYEKRGAGDNELAAVARQLTKSNLFN